ncbi:hypothetical protein PEDI_45750 [Persicobacter diffluens]|uniref:Uncharacterized protein n=1 Tax=Persicobacter diffluens TaxID=981 RepID=A0AAN4W3L6_9BACT|nr:hypothetical protein PEDI_45750 [Persicobacter diffluens]
MKRILGLFLVLFSTNVKAQYVVSLTEQKQDQFEINHVLEDYLKITHIDNGDINGSLLDDFQYTLISPHWS